MTNRAVRCEKTSELVAIQVTNFLIADIQVDLLSKA